MPVNLMKIAMNFLMKQAGSAKKSYSETQGISRSDCVSIVDALSRIRIMAKKASK